MTTTLGEKSLELIRESLRSRDMLRPFNEEKVRAVLEEIKALHDEVLKGTFYSEDVDEMVKMPFM